LKKRLALLDILVVLVMGGLLCYGASWQIFIWYSDVAKYQCYSVAFWGGTSALNSLAVPGPQCNFIVNPSPDMATITNSMVIAAMSRYHFPSWLISFVASQSPTQPLHALPHEYPLLTIIPFTLGLVTSAYWYQVAFAIWMAAVIGVIYFLLKTCRSRRAAIAFALYTVVGCWATAVARYDIVPAGLTFVALLCAERGRWRWAFAVLALATMCKFYPFVLVPAFFIAQQRSKGAMWRRWWSGLDVFVLVCSSLLALSLFLSVDGTLGPFRYFGSRPVQVESSASSLLWLASIFGRYSLTYVYTYGSINVLSPLSARVSLTMTLLLVAGLAYTLWLQWRGNITLSVAILLTLLVLVCTGKVFSPQYLLWVFPFIAYIGESNWKWLGSWLIIGVLTTWIFPYIYEGAHDLLRIPLLPAFHPTVFARDAFMMAFVIALPEGQERCEDPPPVGREACVLEVELLFRPVSSFSCCCMHSRSVCPTPAAPSLCGRRGRGLPDDNASSGFLIPPPRGVEPHSNVSSSSASL